MFWILAGEIIVYFLHYSKYSMFCFCAVFYCFLKIRLKILDDSKTDVGKKVRCFVFFKTFRTMQQNPHFWSLQKTARGQICFLEATFNEISLMMTWPRTNWENFPSIKVSKMSVFCFEIFRTIDFFSLKKFNMDFYKG